MPRPKPHTDLARLEELAARVKPGGAALTQKEIAAELGLAEATFNRRLASYADVRAAFDRGRDRAGREECAGAGAGEFPLPHEAPGRSASAFILNAIPAGARTVGKLLAVTRLDHTKLTVELQGLSQLGDVYVRTVGGERQYFLRDERPPGAPVNP